MTVLVQDYEWRNAALYANAREARPDMARIELMGLQMYAFNWAAARDSSVLKRGG